MDVRSSLRRFVCIYFHSNGTFVMKTEKQSIVPKPLVVIMVMMLGIALLIALSRKPSDDYYVLLKIIICAGCGFLATKAFAVNCVGWGWWLATTAAVYNPFIRIPLGRGLWVIVNIATIIMLVIFQKFGLRK